jgi:prophage tail gpP-like protein
MGHPVNEDTFRLVVDGQECPIASMYDVNAGVFAVPAVFDMVVGHTGLLVELIDNYAEGTPFELLVDDVKVMDGEVTDIAGSGRDATQLRVTGADRLWRLAASEVHSDRSFSEVTFADLTEAAMADVGLGAVSLVSSNLANRKAITGSYKVKQAVTPASESTDTTLAERAATRTKTVLRSLVIESGTTWWDFLVQQYQRGGLFLWADAFGGFVLGQPNGSQDPLYAIRREQGSTGEESNVTFLGQPEWSRSIKQRYSEFHVVGRNGGGKGGRGKATARVIDDEMVALLNPDEADRADGGVRKKVKIYRDDKVKTPAQAKFLALRKMAESRRNNTTLTYTVSGHTTEALRGGGRLVWQPDTVVHVVDQLLGIDGPMYIHNCRYQRTPKSMTILELTRCEDLLFGEEDLLNPPPAPVKKKGLVRMGRTEAFRVESRWKRDPTWGNLPVSTGAKETGLRLNRAGTGFDVIPGTRRL